MKEITLNPAPGAMIGRTCEEACAKAQEEKCMVTFDFNEIILTAMPDTEPGFLSQLYSHLTDVRYERHIESDEYKEREAKRLEAARVRAKQRQEAEEAAPDKMTLKDPDGWKEAQEANSDGYGGAVLSFAERWARLMEGRIKNGEKLPDIADECSSLADQEGITGFMYGCAVGVLSQVWVHGEDLRRWHNKDTQIGDEGDKANESGGVLNPAVLSVGSKPE